MAPEEEQRGAASPPSKEKGSPRRSSRRGSGKEKRSRNACEAPTFDLCVDDASDEAWSNPARLRYAIDRSMSSQQPEG